VLVVSVICPITGRDAVSGYWISVFHDLTAVVDAGFNADLCFIVFECVAETGRVDAFMARIFTEIINSTAKSCA
jgi:hypothetical protein